MVGKVWKIEPGAGKSTAIIPKIIEALDDGLNVVVAMPEHSLTQEYRDKLSKRLQDAGYKDSDVQVWRGVSSAGMCLRPADRDKVQKAKLSVKSTLCQRPLMVGDKIIGIGPACPHAAVVSMPDSVVGDVEPCPMAIQRTQRPRIWIISHATLFHKREAKFLQGGVGILVIDESPLDAAIPAKQSALKIKLDDMVSSLPDEVDDKLTVVGDAPDYVQSFWAMVGEKAKKYDGWDRWSVRWTDDLGDMLKGDGGAFDVPLIEEAINWHRGQIDLLRMPAGLDGKALAHELKKRRAYGVH